MSERSKLCALIPGLLAMAAWAVASDPQVSSHTAFSPSDYGPITVARSSFVPEVDPTLTKALEGLDLQDGLRGDMLKEVSALKGYRFADEHSEVGPTVLETRIVRVALAKDDPADGKPALVLRARARLIQPAHGRSLYDQRLEFRTPKHPLPEWTADDAQLTHQEIARGLKELAHGVADDIFMIYDASLEAQSTELLPTPINNPDRASPPADASKFPNDAGPDRIDVSGYTPEMRQSYEVFQTKCSVCHTIARPINAQYLELTRQELAQARKDDPEIFKDPRVTSPEKGIWKRYVKRMMNKPACPVSGDGRRIWEFLAYDSKRRKMGANGASWRAQRLKLVEDFKKSQPETYLKLFPDKAP